MIRVTVAMIREQTRAMSQSYSAMVKPTERASMEVATPWMKRAQAVSRVWETSSLSFVTDTVEQHASADIGQQDQGDPGE